MTILRPRRTGGRPGPTRRQLITGGLGVGLLGLGTATASFAEAARPDPVRSVTVAYTRSGVREGLDAEAAQRLPALSRVMPGAADAEPMRRQQEFLSRCDAWLERTPSSRRELAVSALLDLWVLSDELPAAVAGWVGPWRYIWPRDTAFVAVALARVGAVRQAWSQLLHLQNVQAVDGSFAARVVPETGLAPDEREPQFDSLGLVLWAVAEVHALARQNDISLDLSDMDILLRRTTRRLLDHTGRGETLPPVGPDYWEVAESQVTLGLAGPTLVGMDSLAALTAVDPGLWDRLGGGFGDVLPAVDAYAATFARTFGATGLQRYPTSGGCDSAAAFLPAAGLVPPPGAGPAAGARASIYAIDADALVTVWDRLSQPAGGIKPGHGWIIDRSSWTPSTSLMALGFARLGMRDRAGQILDWLAENRTSAGSLPEKISAEGAPVSVAPLAWTAANVVIALDELRLSAEDDAS
ncbi:hypothetical protein [Brevibacterium spongiae]|uniref:Glycoside hydrolase family 15 n=1 Tax=Brevibacterium spongiae TaxID=2909672 RepID=A0ABY5SWZ1_9MICO|nr:hypothetical protein [Brevibacterium spongiae]UVI37674.1 hypothetical protein L1F31_08505 [Brevibacterium spongiae]